MSVETGYIKGRLKELRALHKGHLHGMDDVLSNMEKEVDIFIDLIPGYKIQKKQEDEDKAVHAKTTRVVIDIEDEILSKYEKFLNYLLKMRKATVQVVSPSFGALLLVPSPLPSLPLPSASPTRRLPSPWKFAPLPTPG